MSYKKGKKLCTDDLLKMDGQKVIVLEVEKGDIEVIHTVVLNYEDTEDGSIVYRNALVDLNGRTSGLIMMTRYFKYSNIWAFKYKYMRLISYVLF